MDTLGIEKWFVIQRSPLFGGYFLYMPNYLSGPTKAVCYREVSAIGEFAIRGSTVPGIV